MKIKAHLLIRAAAALAALALASAPLHFAAAQTRPGQGQRGVGLKPAASVKELPAASKRWALIIGVDAYQDSQIGPLQGASNDARLLADSLVRYAGFPSDQVILMTTGQPGERQPTRVNILRRLSNLASVVPRDGLLLVSFSGHGMERNGQAYLLPSDAQISDDVTFLEETAVSVVRMKERIKATGVRQVIVLLDACRNDPGGRADAPNPLTEAYTRAFNFDTRNNEVEAFATLYATAVGQRAYEYSEKKQGYFTWAVIEALKGGAADEKGEVTLARLIDYVQTIVPKRIGVDLGSGKRQQPFAVVEGYKADGLVLALAAPAAAGHGAPAADPAALELGFWESIKDSKDPSDFRAYLEKYPEGSFASLARKRAQPAAEASPAAMPDSDKIIERSIAAIGSKEAVQALSTLVFKGVYELTAGGKTQTGIVERYFKLPDKDYLLINVPRGFKEEEGFDGAVGWTKASDGVMVMSGWQLAFKKRSTQLGLSADFARIKEYYPTASVKGTDKVGGRDCYVIEMSPTEGKPETFYFDTQTGLMVRWDIMYESSSRKGFSFPVQVYAEDYAEVGGVKIALTYRQISPGQTSVMRFMDVKYNVPVDESKFRKPSK
jgi:Caspase domain